MPIFRYKSSGLFLSLPVSQTRGNSAIAVLNPHPDHTTTSHHHGHDHHDFDNDDDYQIHDRDQEDHDPYHDDDVDVRCLIAQAAKSLAEIDHPQTSSLRRWPF
jgi:hypothetical protein